MLTVHKSITLEDLPTPPADKTGWPWTEASQVVPATMPNGKPWSKISIVTPSYNQGEFIEETIRSVLLQGYPNLEYIIMDGGSTDQTQEILERYKPWVSYVISEPDSGQSNAINKGFSLATGEIFAWLNSDDIYLKNVLSLVANSFDYQNSTTGALVGIGHKVDRAGKIIYTPKMPQLDFHTLVNHWGEVHFMQPSCFFTSDAWIQSGGLNEDLNFSMDLDLWLKISQKFKFKKIDAVLSHANEHGAAKTQAHREYMHAELVLLLAKYGGEAGAHLHLMYLANKLIETRKQLSRITNNPIYKTGSFVYKILKNFKHFFAKNKTIID